MDFLTPELEVCQPSQYPPCLVLDVVTVAFGHDGAAAEYGGVHETHFALDDAQHVFGTGGRGLHSSTSQINLC